MQSVHSFAGNRDVIGDDSLTWYHVVTVGQMVFTGTCIILALITKPLCRRGTCTEEGGVFGFVSLHISYTFLTYCALLQLSQLVSFLSFQFVLKSSSFLPYMMNFIKLP